VLHSLLTACGGQGGGTDSSVPAVPETICDGSSGLRFATTSSIDPTAIAVASHVLYDLGAHWIYIDGQCHYWAHINNAPGDDWRPVREGTLSPDEVAAIEARFHFGEWTALRGGWGVPDATTHSSVENFYDDRTLIQCLNCCGDAPSDKRAGFSKVCDMALARFELVQQLYDAGADVRSGPMRLLAYPGVYPDEDPSEERTPTHVMAFDWPLSPSLDSFALPKKQIGPSSSLSFGDAHLIVDEAGVAALREARHKYLSGELGPTFSNMMVTSEPGSERRYAVYFRDAIPLENERGLVPRP
jgi:hypothetical protein